MSNNNYPYYPGQAVGQNYRGPSYMDTISNQYMGIKGRPVSSLEEARATSIDFDGSIFYFPDLANEKIYTKQINLDGTATLNVYERKELPDPTIQNFITREEFDKAIEQIKLSFAEIQKVPAGPIGTPTENRPAADFKF